MNYRHELSALRRRLNALAIHFGYALDGDFNEGEHPRDPDGKFAGGGGEGKLKPSGIARNKPPVVKLSGNELNQKPGESLKDAALRYYESLMDGDPAEREGFGKVGFYKGSGWDKFEHKLKEDSEKLKLIPAIKPVIEKGEYLGWADPDPESKNNPKKKDIARYHYFEANVETPAGNRYVGVTVIEDRKERKFYNLNKDPDVLYGYKKKRLASESPDLENGVGNQSGDAAMDALNLIIAQKPEKSRSISMNQFQQLQARLDALSASLDKPQVTATLHIEIKPVYDESLAESIKECFARSLNFRRDSFQNNVPVIRQDVVREGQGKPEI